MTTRTRTRDRRITALLLAVLGTAGVALALTLLPGWPASDGAEPPWQPADSGAVAPVDTQPRDDVPVAEGTDGRPTDADSRHADGVLPDGTSVDDDHLPGVANLDPALLAALREAAADAAAEGVVIQLTSGWRSAAYQAALLAEAVAEHGSTTEAQRWVATPQTSSHVSGDAVDIGPYDAMSWMQQHGPRYGLCQVYANEPWHYELVADAAHAGCPALLPDASASR